MLPEVQFRGKKSNHPFIDWKWCADFQWCKNSTFGGKRSLCSPSFVELLRWCCSRELAAVVEEAFHTQRSDFDAVQLPYGFIVAKCRCEDIAAFTKLICRRHAVVAFQVGFVTVTWYGHDFSVCQASSRPQGYCCCPYGMVCVNAGQIGRASCRERV